MVSKYFNYVLVLAFLVGITAPLPQVKDQFTQSFNLSSNSALAFGSVTSSPMQTQCSTPEHVVSVLVKAGIIPTSSLSEALRIVRTLPGSNGQPGTPINASSTVSRLHVSNIVVTKGNVITAPTGIWQAAYPSISFTLTNTGNNSVYVSKDATIFASTTIAGAAGSVVSIANVTAAGSSTGDTVNSYIINGSRTFTLNFVVENRSSSTASTRIRVPQINYGLGHTNGLNNNLRVLGNLQNAFVQVP